MINIKNRLDLLLKTLDNTFGNRVWFVGLQGSNGRGEYDTNAIKGTLDELLSLIDENAVTKAIKTFICNIYHNYFIRKKKAIIDTFIYLKNGVLLTSR